MLHISINKTQFENILSNNETALIKEATKFWKKNLLEPKIIENKIYYELLQVDKINITNGLGPDKPSVIIECKNTIHNKDENIFIFEFGKILEHKNTDMDKQKDDLIEQLLREKFELEESLSTDHLTQTYNRRKMDKDLDLFIKTKNTKNLVAIFIDADRFKGINDNFGHDTGDRALQYIAKKLKKHAEILDGKVYRYGGEEFLILSFCPEEYLLDKLNNLRIDIKSERIIHPFKKISVTVSLGVSFWNKSNNIDDFIKRADSAVYEAKNKGRDRIEIAN